MTTILVLSLMLGTCKLYLAHHELESVGIIIIFIIIVIVIIITLLLLLLLLLCNLWQLACSPTGLVITHAPTHSLTHLPTRLDWLIHRFLHPFIMYV